MSWFGVFGADMSWLGVEMSWFVLFCTRLKPNSSLLELFPSLPNDCIECSKQSLEQHRGEFTSNSTAVCTQTDKCPQWIAIAIAPQTPNCTHTAHCTCDGSISRLFFNSTRAALGQLALTAAFGCRWLCCSLRLGCPALGAGFWFRCILPTLRCTLFRR